MVANLKPDSAIEITVFFKRHHVVAIYCVMKISKNQSEFLSNLIIINHFRYLFLIVFLPEQKFYRNVIFPDVKINDQVCQKLNHGNFDFNPG